jgi:recombination protein RecA
MSKKQEVIADAMKSIEKQFGKGALIKMGDNANAAQVETVHSGSYLLDIVLGGWYPKGRIIEIYGLESSGKTTVTLLAAAEVQKLGGTVAFIDAEHAFDPNYAAMLGVDIANLYLSQPDYGEQALQISEELAKTGAFDLIIVDSVAALTPRAEIEGDMGDSHMWLQARMMSQGLRKLTGVLAKTNTTIIFINQIRLKIGVVYGNPETTTGGNALKFYASQRLEIRRGDKIEDNKEQVGYNAKIKIVKNKIFPPFKVAEVPIRFASWVDTPADILEASLVLWLISRSWAFYSIADQKFQGKEKAGQYLTDNPNVQQILEAEIKMKIKDIRMGKNVIPLEQLDAIKVNPDEDEVELDVE